MKIILTANELFEAELWEAFADLRDIDEPWWMLSDTVERDTEYTLTEEDCRRLGVTPVLSIDDGRILEL